jgi:hypothetical protein
MYKVKFIKIVSLEENDNNVIMWRTLIILISAYRSLEVNIFRIVEIKT